MNPNTGILSFKHLVLGWISLWGVHSGVAYADIPDIETLFPESVSNALVKSIGLAMDHRAYEPATPLGTAIGIDFGVEVTLAKPPSDLSTALSELGGGSSSLPILPSAKLHLHKGISEDIDLGLSILPPISSIPYIGGSLLIGGDVKICIFKPEEGLISSLRVSYNYNRFAINEISINTYTISPQLLFSRKMNFADPYIGIGLQYAYGSVDATFDIPTTPPAPTVGPVTLSRDGAGYGFNIFGGVSLRIPAIGLRFDIEGAYNTSQVNYMGTKIGFRF